MSIIAVVQARMGSTRLPGKSAMLYVGKPIVWHVLRRVRQAKLVDLTVLAIPEEENNLSLIEAARWLQVPVIEVKGNPNDLLLRYNLAARAFDADLIVRVPADNPCVMPGEIDLIIRSWEEAYAVSWDHLATNLNQNVAGNGYPGGLGAEVYERDFLTWLHENVTDPRLREHPHLWAFEHQRVFTVPWAYSNHADLRFDVNTWEDFHYVRKIYDALYDRNPDFRTEDILKIIDRSIHGECGNG